MLKRFLVAAGATLLLTACQREAPAPSAEENRQMDEAADLLDAAPGRLEAVDDSAVSAADVNAAEPDVPGPAVDPR